MTAINDVYILRTKIILEEIEDLISQTLPNHEKQFLGKGLGFYDRETYKQLVVPGRKYILGEEHGRREAVYQDDIFNQFVSNTVYSEAGEVLYRPSYYRNKVLFETICSPVALDIFINFAYIFLNRELPSNYGVMSKDDTIYYLLTQHYPELEAILKATLGEIKGSLSIDEIMTVIPFTVTLNEIYIRVKDYVKSLFKGKEHLNYHQFTVYYDGSSLLIGDLGDYRINEWEQLKEIELNHREKEANGKYFNEQFSLFADEKIIIAFNHDFGVYSDSAEEMGYRLLKVLSSKYQS